MCLGSYYRYICLYNQLSGCKSQLHTLTTLMFIYTDPHLTFKAPSYKSRSQSPATMLLTESHNPATIVFPKFQGKSVLNRIPLNTFFFLNIEGGEMGPTLNLESSKLVAWLNTGYLRLDSSLSECILRNSLKVIKVSINMR